MSALAGVPPTQPGYRVDGDPPTQLAALLAPLKREQVPFDAAWWMAWQQIVWPVSRREARDWQQMMLATREGWHAAYDDEPQTRPELVLVGLADKLPRAA